MDDNGVQPYATFYPPIQAGSHDKSAHPPVYSSMPWASQAAASVNNFYTPQPQHVLPWSATSEAHIPPHYPHKDMPLSSGESNAHYGENSQDYHGHNAMYLSSHTDQASMDEYYQPQHYHSYSSSGRQEGINPIAPNVPVLDSNMTDSISYNQTIQSSRGDNLNDATKGHPTMESHSVTAIVDGWDEADLAVNTDLNPWDGKYTNQGNNVNQTDACDQGSVNPPEASSTVREGVSNIVNPRRLPTSQTMSDRSKEKLMSSTRVPQTSECSDMEIYWKETRQPFYATEVQTENSNKGQVPMRDGSDFAAAGSNEDQSLLLQKFNRQDSTWASPILDNTPTPLSTEIKSQKDSVGFLENSSLPSVPLSKSSGFNKVQPEVIHMVNREAVTELPPQRDDPSASDVNIFPKAVGAERHKESTNEHILSNHPTTAFQPIASASVNKPSGDKMSAKMTPLKVSTKSTVVSNTQRSANSDPKTVGRTTATAAAPPNPSAFSSLPSRRKPEAEDNSNRKPQLSSSNTSTSLGTSASTSSSRWQPPVPNASQKGNFKPVQQSGGPSQMGGSNLNSRERGSPRTLQHPVMPSRSAGITRPSNLGSTTQNVSHSQYPGENMTSSRYYSRKGVGANSPTSGHMPDPSMNSQPYGKTSYRQQVVDPSAAFARQPIPTNSSKRNVENTTQSYPWRMTASAMRSNGGTASGKGSQGGSDYGETGRCPSRTSFCSDELSYSTIYHNMDQSTAWAYPGYPLSPGFSRKQEADMWHYYRQADPNTMYQAYAAATGGNSATHEWWDQFYKCALANGKSLEELQAFTEQYKQIMMHFQGLFMPKPDRLTPKLFAKPHRVVWANQPGVLLQVPAHLPQEGQPAVVELQTLPSWEEERIVHATFPGPLSREGTLKGEVRAFLRTQLADIRHTMPPQWDSVCLLLTYLDLLVQANGAMEHNEMAKLLMEGHELRTEDLRPTSQLLASSDSHSQLNIGENERFASLPPSEPPSGRVSPTGGDGGGRLSRPQSRAASILSAAADTLLRRQALARQTRGIAGGLAASGLAHYNMEQADRYLDQYRLLIMRNEKLQALEYSCKHGLWGCAFALASQLPNATKLLPTVLARFLHQAMQISDPLQTFHHLLAGQVPAFLRNGLTGPGTNVEWGDWRPHLAMILSAQPQQPQLAIQCMNHLGDNLGAARILYASQLCYIFAESAFNVSYSKEWTVASKSAGKVTLIGADFHRRTLHQMGDEYFPVDTPRNTTRHFEEHYDPLLARMATDLAIQLTEIYEYACALKQRDFYLPHLVPFKFLYATRLLDAGFVERAFRYCKVVSVALRQRPELYSRSLFHRVISLSERLQFHPECSHIDSFEDGNGELLQFGSSNTSAYTWIEHLRATYYTHCQIPQPMKHSSSHHISEVNKPVPVAQTIPHPTTAPLTLNIEASPPPPSYNVRAMNQETALMNSISLPTISSIPSAHQPPQFSPPSATIPHVNNVSGGGPSMTELSGNRGVQQLHHSYPPQVAQVPQPTSQPFNSNTTRSASDVSSLSTVGDMGLDMGRSNASLSQSQSANVSLPPVIGGIHGSYPSNPMQLQQTLQQSTSNVASVSMSQSTYASYPMSNNIPDMSAAATAKMTISVDSMDSVTMYTNYEQFTSPYDMQQTNMYSHGEMDSSAMTNVTTPTNQSPSYQEQLHISMGSPDISSGPVVSDIPTKQLTSTPTPPSRPRREEPPRDSPPPGLPYQPPMGFFVPQMMNTFTPKENVDGGGGGGGSSGGFDYFRDQMQFTSSDVGVEESGPLSNTNVGDNMKSSKSGSFTDNTNPSYRQPTKPAAAVPSPPAPGSSKSEPAKTPSEENDGKSQKDASSTKSMGGNAGGSWFKVPFWPKKNIAEVHLPDDSHKALQYDPVKKVWIDTTTDSSADQKDDSGPPQMFKAPPPNAAPVAPINRTSSRYVGISTASNPNGPVSVVPPFGRPMGIPNVFVPPNIHSQERSAED